MDMGAFVVGAIAGCLLVLAVVVFVVAKYIRKFTIN